MFALILIPSVILLGITAAVYFLYINKASTKEDKEKRIANVKLVSTIILVLGVLIGGGPTIFPLLLASQTY